MTEYEHPYHIEVTAESFYLPDQSDPDEAHYVFAYRITLRNVGSVSAQLVSRHWIITDGSIRSGRGVIEVLDFELLESRLAM